MYDFSSAVLLGLGVGGGILGMADGSEIPRGLRRRSRDVSDLGNLRPRKNRRQVEAEDFSFLLGPESLKEAGTWAAAALGLLCCIFPIRDAEPRRWSLEPIPSQEQLIRRERLEHSIECGFNINTNFSGFDCPMLALKGMEETWVDCGLSQKGQQVVQSYSACDELALARDTLMSASPEHCPRHVFGDVMDRLPASTRIKVVQALPPADAEADIIAFC